MHDAILGKITENSGELLVSSGIRLYKYLTTGLAEVSLETCTLIVFILATHQGSYDD